MAQDTTPAIIVYRGNGDNSVPYDVPFDKGYYGEVKVLFVRRGLADYTYNPTTYTVNGRLYAWFSGTGYVYTHTPNPAVGAEIYNNFDEDTGDTVSAVSGQTITDGVTTYTRAVQHDIANQLLLTWTGTVLTSDDFICIARETERGQPYEYPNNQKHIETALDNLERQIQEVANKADNALLVDPAYSVDSTKMNPIDWLKSIIRCIDFSVRAVRYANGWLDYSLDDPNIADGSKTWTHILNTDNIKNIRERSDIVDGVTIYWTEYQASDGTWRTLANTSYWESRIQYAVDTAEDAKDVADDAKDIAQDAKNIADTFDGRLTQAETDASDAKNAAAGAVNTVNNHVTNYNNPHQVTKTQVGLGNCDNTSDLNKPISTATQNALDLKLPTSTKYGANFSLSINSSTYVVTAQLKDQDGNNLGSAQTIDLPLESVVVSGSYDADNKKIVLTLQDGSTIDIPVGDLISGLQTEITNDNKLDADLVDDSTSTNKFVTATDKSTWSGKQDAIVGAATSITASNLANARAVVSDANGKIAASTTTSTEIGYLSGTTSSVQTQLNNKQATLVSGTNIKTINSGSLLGSGNIDVLVNEATPASSLGVGYTTINTTYTDSINIGNGAQVGANNALALGAFASAEGQDSIAIYSSTGTAHRARTTHTGNIAIGYNALAINAAYTIAIGYNAYAQGANSIQLGTGQVALQNTFQVWTYPMLDKTSGLIPAARFADQTSATQGQVLTLDANLDAEWKTISTMTGASAGDAGTGGLVPAPAAGDQQKFLQGDGTWANPTAGVAWGNITGTLSNQTDLQDALDVKANTSLSNLTDTGKNISNWSTNVTNCITNIPQDIKLELSSGTLTLKAGSKVYVPNGFEQDGVTPKFDVVTIASDITDNVSVSDTNTRFVYYINGVLAVYANMQSGTTPPSTGTNIVFYNTSDNTIKRYTSGSVGSSGYSFPIAKVTADGTYVYGSIDQVFNGFGYIGSHLFALPNLSVLVPYGRNDDGTLKSKSVVLQNVQTYTRNLTQNDVPIWVKDDGTIHLSNGVIYDADVNSTYRTAGGYFAQIGNIDVNSGVLSNISKKEVYKSVDYSDSEYIANCSMPSGNITNLTLGASGATYTAPADGYIQISKNSTATGQYLYAYVGGSLRYRVYSSGASQALAFSFPISRDQQFTVEYTVSSSGGFFRFINANGVK